MKYLRFALPLLFLPTADLLADSRDAALKLPDVVISANRQVQARNDSSAANTVFTRDDIDRLQPSSVTDLLSRVPGVQVARTGGRGSLPGIFIRGTKSAQSLVLVDGQRIANTTSGDSGLQYLNVDQIERVEVLRGSRSVIYGSDAIGGVIQIFTRRNAGQGLQPRLKLGFGSNNTWERSLGLSGGDERTRFNLGASLDETAGIDWSHASFPSDRDHDAYRNKSLSLNLSHEFSDELEVGFNLLDSRGKSEYDGFGEKPYTDYTVSSASAYIDAQLNEAWQTRVELGHSENRDTKRDKLSPDFSVFNTYRDSINWQNDLTLDQQNSLILGGDWYEDRFHGSTTFSENSRWNRAAFIQHRFKGEWFSTELGLRHDDNQQFGAQNSWSGTLTLPVSSDNDLLLSYSEGFRAPTFNDLYYPGSSNPNLKPEHSKSYELQWRSQLTDTTRLETSLYRTDLKDAIIAQQQNNYIPYNVATARINGFEAALKQELFGWQGNLGLSIIDPRDRTSGHTLARRARRTLNLDLDRQFDQLSLGASWQAISSSYDAEDNKNRLAGYYLVGLRSGWALNREVVLSLKVDNLLDRRYTRAWYSYNDPNFQNNQPYREEGRTWMVGVTWTPQL
ncbi:TonB-dependent receptor domain-containing protein [Pseudomonas proteolytica]|uniref:TonB-dependent receptor domain-containing protein n=1 Tax=Pseudomonas proteolytica TaxID=219574 RepID=UPI001472EFF4|nr:TonB-dependent receptor [Pseudomonas proteolytica]NMZ43156.1 TonB-dependent receptor [Pseudomonas proteolytica]